MGAAEDPSFRFSRDEETGQTIIEGMGELHLEIIVDRMKREFNVEANVGAPHYLTVKQSPRLQQLITHTRNNQVDLDNMLRLKLSLNQRIRMMKIWTSNLSPVLRVVMCQRNTSLVSQKVFKVY